MSDFRSILVTAAKNIVVNADRCSTEEATKQFLILPFIGMLGYNVFNPSEVVPEHQADFSEKYKNRADYVIMRDGQPVIALEAKLVGAQLEGDRGQLKRYFNAQLTVKLGVLTDGLVYECFAETASINVMDDAPFLTFDLREIATGKFDQRILNGIEELKKDNFDPASVGSAAKRRLLLSKLISVLDSQLKEPTDEFVRLFLKETAFDGNVTAKVVQEHRDLVRQAVSAFIDRTILSRVGLDRTEVQSMQPTPQPVAQHESPPATVGGDLITTKAELAAYDYAVRRLTFLVNTEEAYAEIEHIKWQDFKTVFRVYYRTVNSGGLFTLKERADGLMVFNFPVLEDREIQTKNLSDIDKPLLESFERRLSERNASKKGK
jgi:predicted type IV restriction endonuclease